MDTELLPVRPVSDPSTYFNHISHPTITAIRREHMPGDARSAFLPEDIILFQESNRKSLSTEQKNAQARWSFILLDLKCPWCRADVVCLGLTMGSAALVWLGAAFVECKETFAFHGLKFNILILLASSLLLGLSLIYMKRRTKAYDSVDLRCAKDVKLHFVFILASRILNSSSLLLLKQPMVNVRSFFRYYQFFSKGKAGELPDEEVDSCIRHLAHEEGALSLASLIGDGSYALLGLEPCRDMFPGTRWGFSWLNVLYQSYRDWKRWRLATIICERLQERRGVVLQQSCMDRQSPLEGLGGRGGHKWLLVDPKLFSSSVPSQQPAF